LSANNCPEEEGVQVKRLRPKGLNVRVVSGHVLYSHVVTVTGGTHVFIAGQLARDADGTLVGRGDMRAQIEQVVKNLQQCSRLPVPGSTTWSNHDLRHRHRGIL
jgi:enamine deaminase RidA (YjgF/YER057c/UK114 family)